MLSSYLYLLSKGLARIICYTLIAKCNSRRLRLVLAVLSTKRVKRMRFNIVCAIYPVLVSRSVHFSMSPRDITLILNWQRSCISANTSAPISSGQRTSLFFHIFDLAKARFKTEMRSVSKQHQFVCQGSS